MNLLKALLLGVFTLFVTTTSFAQWTNLGTASDSTLRLNGMSFPTESIGYSFMDKNGGGAESLYKTTNGANDWVKIALDSNFDNANFLDISFPTQLVGYLSVNRFAPSLTSKILKTIDGGNSWTDVTPLNVNPSYNLINVDFVSETTGYISVDNKIFKTTDGGKTWTSKRFTSIVHGLIHEIDFVDEDYGLMGTWDGTFNYKGAVYFTNNGGVTWDSLQFDSVNTSITRVQQVTKDLSFAMGGQSWFTGLALYKSNNGGMTWDTLSLSFLTDSMDQANDFHFESEFVGSLITQNGYVYGTSDGGVTWAIEHKEKYGLELIEPGRNGLLISGNIDVLLANSSISNGIAEFESDLINVHPNPARIDETMTFSKALNGQTLIYQLNGVLVYSREVENMKTLNPMDFNMSAGLYFLVNEKLGGKPIKLMVR
ncbi:MAG: WD40/YVTN/BNR-like repeat-containing protein [Salibacteraceae bacterium]